MSIFLLVTVAPVAGQEDICPDGFEARPFFTANYCFQTELPAGGGYDAQGNARCLDETPFGFWVPRTLKGGAELPGAPGVTQIGYLKSCHAEEADRNRSRENDPEWQAASPEWRQRNAGIGDIAVGVDEPGTETGTESGDQAGLDGLGDAAEQGAAGAESGETQTEDSGLRDVPDSGAAPTGQPGEAPLEEPADEEAGETGRRNSAVGTAGAIGLLTGAAAAAAAAARRRREPPVPDPELFPDELWEPASRIARTVWELTADWADDEKQPPLLHTYIDRGDASARWLGQHRRQRWGVRFPPTLEASIKAYDRAAEDARRAAGLSFEEELAALVRDRPAVAPILRRDGDVHIITSPGAFGYGGMRDQLRWTNKQRAKRGEAPLTPAQETEYRRWLNHYYSWWRRAIPHMSFPKPQPFDDKASLEFSPGGSRA